LEKWGNLILCFALGLTVYIYLPIRAAGQAFINWGEPSNFIRFWKVISRASYGHTLDLISREVSLKQVFLPHIILFLKSLVKDLAVIGALLAIVGIIFNVRNEGDKKIRLFYIMMIFIFLLTGPFFLYMAKMPVNPHAVAIVDVSYMIPEMIFAIFAATGLLFIINKFKSFRYFKYGISIFAVCFLISNAFITYSNVNKQKNFFAEDYALNILNTVDKNAAVIMRRDHTMFAVWYMKDIEGVRRDVKVISKGLLSAVWYRNKLRLDHPQINWKEDFYTDDEYIDWFYKTYENKFSIYLTAAAASELNNEFFNKYKLQPVGLVLKIVKKNYSVEPAKIEAIIDENYRFKGAYNTKEYYDFFTKDFISLYAQFFDRLGLEYSKNNNMKKARDLYKKAIQMDSAFHKSYSNIAYSFYDEKKYDDAQKFYTKAIKLIERKMKQYTRGQFFKKDLAEAYNNLGATYEKMLSQTNKTEYFDKALYNYSKALIYSEKYSQAYYNIGVLYWGIKDWEKVTEYFSQALKYDPQNTQIKKYLIIAKQNLRQKY